MDGGGGGGAGSNNGLVGSSFSLVRYNNPVLIDKKQVLVLLHSAVYCALYRSGLKRFKSNKLVYRILICPC